MIGVDTNILVYAHRQDSPFHKQAYASVKSLCSNGAPWAIPWACLHEFYSIVTHPRIYNPPSTPDQAIEQIEAWMEAPNLLLLSEKADYWPVLKVCLTVGKIAGPIVHDARIASICQQNGVSELWTADRDFSRFQQLSIVNPLVR